MTQWDGQGLPPAAQARIDRFATTHVRTSLLSVPAAATLDRVGFDTVGEVMGCMVQQISWAGWGGCGYYGGYGWGGPPIGGPLGRGLGGALGGMGGFGRPPMTSTVPLGRGGYGGGTMPSSAGGFGGYAPYVNAMNGGYETAIYRMLVEAAALGADGVVGVRLSADHLAEHTREFVAMGTAVRARSDTRPAAVFSTDLPGTDVAKLLLAGWAPVAVQVALEIAIRHDDYYTRQQASSWMSGNTEVSGYTELVHYARAFARDQWAAKIAHSGADGAVVSALNLRVWEIEPSDGHRDHVAEATIHGTAIARFRHVQPSDRPRPLAILPLRARSAP